jgi:glutamine amidotransferase
VTTVALIDYGAGNLVSIGQALELLGVEVRPCRRPDELAGADALVVPGVGASGPAMTRLRRQGLDRAIPDAVVAGAWYVGICLGLQLLFERSEEDGAQMLGLMPGNVALLPNAPKLPHIGWNGLEPVGDPPLLRGIARGTPAYFVHSYVVVPDDPSSVVAETVHGGRFASAIAQGRLLGVQFHPERSGADGLRILANVIALIEGHAAGTAGAGTPLVAVS